MEIDARTIFERVERGRALASTGFGEGHAVYAGKGFEDEYRCDDDFLLFRDLNRLGLWLLQRWTVRWAIMQDGRKVFESAAAQSKAIVPTNVLKGEVERAEEKYRSVQLGAPNE